MTKADRTCRHMTPDRTARNDAILDAWANDIFARDIAAAHGISINLVKVVVWHARQIGDARAVKRDDAWRRARPYCKALFS